MKITPLKTKPIVPGQSSLPEILDQFVPNFSERSILVVTSKIISICEGSVLKKAGINKVDIVKQEADFFLPTVISKHKYALTIKNGILIPTAGIDESNGANHYILWPKNPQQSANQIRTYLKKRFGLKNAGTIITDSKTTPLRYGTTGIALAHSGFVALKDYVGIPDVFGVKMGVTKANIMDGLAAAAVLVMGECAEQTPLAIISDLPFVEFQDRNPNKKELDELKIKIEDDLYAPLLSSVKWQRGRKK